MQVKNFQHLNSTVIKEFYSISFFVSIKNIKKRNRLCMKFPIAFRFALYGHLSTPVPTSVCLLISEVLICNSYSQFPNPQFLSATVSVSFLGTIWFY